MRASLGRRFRLVNSQLLVTSLGFTRWAAAGGEFKDADYANLAVERKGDNAAFSHLFRALLDALSVDPDVTGFDHMLREGTALHEADEEEEAV